ncbi:MAG: hypothetical protein WCA04_11120 [Geobacteraceae bacterium]
MMEYRIGIHHDGGYIEVSAQGRASNQGFLAFINELLEPDMMKLNYNLLVDFSLLDTSALGSDDIRTIVSFLELRKDTLRPKKNALVATSSVTFGFARMYQLLSEGVLPMNIQVFNSREQALEWLQDSAG